MKFTIAKGYYWSKELFIEHFRLAVYPENLPKIVQIFPKLPKYLAFCFIRPLTPTDSKQVILVAISLVVKRFLSAGCKVLLEIS
jgi:hypothetical protein